MVTSSAFRRSFIIATGALVCVGCSDEPGDGGATSGAGSGNGIELLVPVPAVGRVFVDIRIPTVVSVPGDGSTSTVWDLAFEGYEVFTNSGVSGPGQGGALGPYGPDIYESGIDPGSPIITFDSIGGAFHQWYAYDYTKPAHALYSRYHVFGVKDGDRLWKVQILSYYGEVAGAPVSAMYRLRYAELFPGSISPTVELENIDGTAGGPTGTESSPSGCLDLGTGKQTMIAPKDTVTSMDWHLCFRREAIHVNGELGGPRGILAVDFESALTPTETVDSVSGKTPESELSRFELVTYEALLAKNQAFRGDRVVSIFADQWLSPGGPPAAPLPATWVVVHAADGKGRALVTFPHFQGPTDISPGTIVLNLKPVVN